MALPEQVVRYTATVPVLTFNILGDVGPRVLGVAERLNNMGYLANVRALAATNSPLSPFGRYRQLVVTLSKSGQPFSPIVATAAIVAAAGAESISIPRITEDMIEAVTFVKNDVTLTPDFSSLSDPENPFKLNIPKWVVPTAIGLGVLYALTQVATISRLFGGGKRSLGGLGCGMGCPAGGLGCGCDGGSK